MAGKQPPRDRGDREVEISLPFTGRWLVESSDLRRVPSHGTDLFGERYAIDFVGVDDRHRTPGTRDWRTLVATEPPERFVAFARPVLAPGDGTVVHVHDAEPDHEAPAFAAGADPVRAGPGRPAPPGCGCRRGEPRGPPPARERHLRPPDAPAAGLGARRSRPGGRGRGGDRAVRQLRQ